MPKTDAPNADSAWQQRAVDRSLGGARDRAVSRSGQILDAARSLLAETGGIDFTVQEIVDRSGLSLRSFYKHFAGKDELLLALFEDLLRAFADDLRSEVDLVEDPVDQLRAYVLGFSRRAEASGAHGGRALGTYHVRMLEVRRQEFVTALAPQIQLLHEIVDRGVRAGRFRDDLDVGALTGLLTITLMAAAQMAVLDVHLSGSSLGGEELWAWCAAAVGAPVPERSAAGRSAPRSRTARTAAARPAGAESPAKPRAKRTTTRRTGASG